MNTVFRIMVTSTLKWLTALFITGCLMSTGPALLAQTIDFPNTGSSVNIGDLDVTGSQVTIEALIYLKKATTSGNIVSKHFTPANVNYLLRPLTFEITTYLQGNSGPTHFIQLISPFKLSLNRWYHVAGTYDGSRIKYYVDGCLVIDSAFTGNLYQNNFTATIGNRSSCQCEQFSGKLDEVRIWKVARTQKEIAANMMTLANMAYQPGLLAYYKFDNNYINSQGDKRWTGTPAGTPAFANADAAVQSFEVTGVQTTNTDCDKVTNGGISVFTNQPRAAYSLDGLHYQAANQFSALKAGDYTVYTRGGEGCTIKNDVTVGNNHAFIPVKLTASLCRQNAFMGHTLPGTYTDTLPATGSCDTLRTVYLTESQRSIVSENRVICEGSAYLGHKATGVYADTLVAANGCDSIRILHLTVLPAPHPDLGTSRSICKGDTVSLTPGAYNSYLWQDGSTQEHLTATDAGLYTVKVVNDCGTKQQQVLITDGKCGLFFPTAFTPNGDGVNDVFKPVAYNLPNFQWKIFNRFGQLVFETKDAYTGWNGRINGQLQNPGVLVWTCSYTRNNQTQIKKGTLVLIR